MADKPDKKPHRPTKINWVEARKVYVEDHSMSYAKIAAKFGVSKTVVEQRAKKEGWPKARQELGEQATKDHESKVVEELSQLNIKHEKAYTSLVEATEARLEKLRADIRDGEAKANHATQLQQLAAALRVGIEGVRVIRGLPIIIAKSESQVDISKPPREPGEAKETMDALDARKERFRKIMAKDEPVDGKPQDKQEAKA